MLFSSKDPYQQVCPVGLLGAGGFFKAVFLTTELPRSLCWPLSPYLAAQLSEMLVRMKRRGEWRGRRASVRMTSLHLSLPVEGFSSTGSRNCPPTQSYCSQECEPETWGHISLKKSREIWCISSSSERAESLEGHCSVHLQQVRGALLCLQSSLCLPLWHKSTESVLPLFLYQTSPQSHFIETLVKMSVCWFVFFYLRQKLPGKPTSNVWILWKCEMSRHVDKLCWCSIECYWICLLFASSTLF